MSQQINLLNPSLIEQKKFPNFNMMAIALALLSLGLMTFYGYLRWQSIALTKQHDEVTEELLNMQQRVSNITSSKARAPDPGLLTQIDLLTEKQRVRQHFLSMIWISSHEKTRMYSEIMRAFATQSITGLWLTEFNIDSQVDTINIRGRALKAETVPVYIANLGENPVFNGQQFAELEMHLIHTDPITPIGLAVSTTMPNPDVSTNLQIAGSGINSSATASNVVANTNAVTEKPVPMIEAPQLIEFVLKSDKKTTESERSLSVNRQKS